MPNLIGLDNYNNQVRQLEATDLAVPATWNTINQQLINNDVSLQNNKASKLVTITGTGGLTGGGDLSANRQLSIANGGVTDAHVGNRTVNDATAPTGDTGTITTVLGWLANMIKAITGGATWRTAPATTLAAASTHMAATAAGTHGSTSAATASTLMHRDASGRAKVAAPAAADDIARKDTVDTVQTNLTNHTGATAAGTHGSTSAATASTLMHRDASGRAKVAAPAAADDIARKDTVDTVQTNLTNHTGAASGAHAATAISSVAAGNLSATNVQAALNELDTEKVSKTGDTMTGDLTIQKATPTIKLRRSADTQVEAIEFLNAAGAVTAEIRLTTGGALEVYTGGTLALTVPAGAAQYVQLPNLASEPAVGPAGSFCFVAGKPRFSNGTKWQSAGVSLGTILAMGG